MQSIFSLLLVAWIFSCPKIMAIEIGDLAPEINLPSLIEAEVVHSLEEKLGEVIYVDFWASWCFPCRRENPNIVSAYNKYSKSKFKNAKGFKIYSVSLDKSKEAWIKAIEQDNLTWKEHVSDLKGWGSQGAGIYGVRGIPTNFLLDADGKIIAKNLRGIALHKELDKLVKSL